ncbi:hypothetical protein [Ornithinimicrobium avium]|uniref:Uncharacterized protein n=1 Tax=Ornithinimicrobium avium TaxID=2283195 RepID=A0A345NKA7_9MICO|nr:hypothetical protein [Ornithinimicrobium avium]AXH95465.1 hypothetical protein DV701_04365 [Ornithinimicrobium avium]
MLRELLNRLLPERQEGSSAPESSDRSLSLREFNIAHAAPLEEMLGVDGLTPVDPHLPTQIPGELEMQLWISAYLQQCPDMFDEGTLDFLSPYLRAQEQLWTRASEVAERSAQTAAHRIRSANDEHLQIAKTRLAQLEVVRADTIRLLAQLNATLNPEGPRIS